MEFVSLIFKQLSILLLNFSNLIWAAGGVMQHKNFLLLIFSDLALSVQPIESLTSYFWVGGAQLLNLSFARFIA